MILGTGIDIIEVERVKRAAAKEGFMERVFTETERQRLKSCNNDPQRIAGAFSAKEAVAKALGTGIGIIEWREIEITHNEKGGPLAALSGKALKLMNGMGGRMLHVSISHIKDIAVAQAILEG